jgi:hypothetical protein
VKVVAQQARFRLTAATVRRLLPILLLVGLLSAPAVARAQAPADASAFADAAVQFKADFDQVQQRFVQAQGSTPVCVRGLVPRFPKRAERGFAPLQTLDLIRRFGRMIAPVFETLSLRLHAVQTDDPALRGGRTAWRRIRRFFAVQVQHTAPFCQALRGYMRAGFRPTPAVREARRMMAELNRLGHDSTRRLRAARSRLEALGIPHERAVAFEG